MPQRTIRYGDVDVPVIDRASWCAAMKQPYRKTYRLKPGQHWNEAESTPAQWENYVALEGAGTVPVGAAIARELADEGAIAVVFTEMWGGLVLVGPDLVCVEERGPIHDMLEAIRARTGGGSVRNSVCEAKRLVHGGARRVVTNDRRGGQVGGGHVTALAW